MGVKGNETKDNQYGYGNGDFADYSGFDSICIRSVGELF